MNHLQAYEHLRAYCEKHNVQLDDAYEYGEPGYPDAPHGILLCNWNDIPKGLAKVVEDSGIHVEYSDEWYVSCESSPSKAWRTSPDSHGWEPRVMYRDGDVITADDDISLWIEECAFNQSPEVGRIMPSWWSQEDIEAQGWRLIEQRDFESGWHPGQNDNPSKAVKSLFDAGHHGVLLQKTEQSQFYCKWRAYVQVEEEQEQVA